MSHCKRVVMNESPHAIRWIAAEYCIRFLHFVIGPRVKFGFRLFSFFFFLFFAICLHNNQMGKARKMFEVRFGVCLVARMAKSWQKKRISNLIENYKLYKLSKAMRKWFNDCPRSPLIATALHQPPEFPRFHFHILLAVMTTLAKTLSTPATFCKCQSL